MELSMYFIIASQSKLDYIQIFELNEKSVITIVNI